MVFNCTHKKLWLFKQYFIVITINFFTIEEVKKTKNTSCRFRAICEHNLFTPTPTVNFNKFVSLSNMKKKKWKSDSSLRDPGYILVSTTVLLRTLSNPDGGGARIFETVGWNGWNSCVYFGGPGVTAGKYYTLQITQAWPARQKKKKYIYIFEKVFKKILGWKKST